MDERPAIPDVHPCFLQKCPQLPNTNWPPSIVSRHSRTKPRGSPFGTSFAGRPIGDLKTPSAGMLSTSRANSISWRRAFRCIARTNSLTQDRSRRRASASHATIFPCFALDQPKATSGFENRHSSPSIPSWPTSTCSRPGYSRPGSSMSSMMAAWRPIISPLSTTTAPGNSLPDTEDESRISIGYSRRIERRTNRRRERLS